MNRSNSFPRMCNTNLFLPGTGMAVTKDLLLSCPTWQFLLQKPDSVVPQLRKAMIEFRKRWSYKVVNLACSVQPDYYDWGLATSLVECHGGWLWRVTGPQAFLDELKEAANDTGEPCVENFSLYLCRHEVIEFDPAEITHDSRCFFEEGCTCHEFERMEELTLGFSLLETAIEQQKERERGAVTQYANVI